MGMDQIFWRDDYQMCRQLTSKGPGGWSTYQTVAGETFKDQGQRIRATPLGVMRSELCDTISSILYARYGTEDDWFDVSMEAWRVINKSLDRYGNACHGSVVECGGGI